MSLSAVILAGGRGTRMKSRRPKPLHEVCGRAMVYYVIRACRQAGCERIYVVVGQDKEQMMAACPEEGVEWVEQPEALGTAHAVRMCEKQLRKLGGDVLVLGGDAPLVRPEVLRTLGQTHREERAAVSLATAVLEDPRGFRRVVRDEKGEFVGVVEEAEATPQQREIREVFPRYYCLHVEDVLGVLGKVSNENRRREYDLSGIFRLLGQARKRIVAVQVVAAEEAISVNTRQQLAEVDAVMQDRIQRRLKDAGVTIVSGGSTYVEDGASIGADTVIEPFVFVGRDSTVGPDCVLGPFAMLPRNSLVPEGVTIAGNITAETAALAPSGR